MDKPHLHLPPRKKLIGSVALAAGVAALLLVLFVLPAEYGIDVTGAGRALGLTQLAAPTRTIEVRDVIGGNDAWKTVELPATGDPLPLPNPAVYQDEGAPPQTRTLEVVIPPEGETEVKVVLQSGKAIVFSWQTDRGDVYVDYHGHDPMMSNEYWVRYKEQQEGTGNSGSLVAPFTGEHGWFWLNYNDYPVTITLTVTGYFDDIIDYGIF
ncbi:MAG: hypothetical protein RLZZ227_2007 [Pseudomonadota bacterium]|jgi:hypothetical protein